MDYFVILLSVSFYGGLALAIAFIIIDIHNHFHQHRRNIRRTLRIIKAWY